MRLTRCRRTRTIQCDTTRLNTMQRSMPYCTIGYNVAQRSYNVAIGSVFHYNRIAGAGKVSPVGCVHPCAPSTARRALSAGLTCVGDGGTPVHTAGGRGSPAWSFRQAGRSMAEWEAAKEGDRHGHVGPWPPDSLRCRRLGIGLEFSCSIQIADQKWEKPLVGAGDGRGRRRCFGSNCKLPDCSSRGAESVSQARVSNLTVTLGEGLRPQPSPGSPSEPAGQCCGV